MRDAAARCAHTGTLACRRGQAPSFRCSTAGAPIQSVLKPPRSRSIRPRRCAPAFQATQVGIQLESADPAWFRTERRQESGCVTRAAGETPRRRFPPRHSFDGRTARALKRLARCGSTRPHKKSCASACAISSATSGSLRCVLQVRAARAARDSRRGCANRQAGHFAGAAECRNALIHRECLAYPERPTVRDISHIA